MKESLLKSTVLIVTIILNFGVNSQAQVPDSLYRNLDASDSKLTEAKALTDLGNAFFGVNADSAGLYLEAAAEIYRETGINQQRAKLHDRLARFYFNQNKIVQSKAQSLKAIEIAQDMDSLRLEIQFIHNLNERIYLTHNLFEEALKTLLDVKNRAIKSDNKSAVFESNKAIYNVYFLSKTNDEQRTELAIQNLKLANEIGDEAMQMTARFDMALAYSNIGELDSAFSQYVSILKFESIKNNHDLQSRLYNNMGSLFRAKQEIDSAALYFEKAYTSAEIAGRLEGMAASKLKMGNLRGSGGDLQGAYDDCLTAFNLFKEAGVLRRQDACLECLYEASKGLNNFQDALSWYEQSLVLKDSFVTSNAVENIKRVENQFLLAQTKLEDSLMLAESNKLNAEKLRTKNAEIKQKELEKEKDLYIKYALFFGLLIIVLTGIYVFKKYKDSQKQKKTIELAHAELGVKNKEITDSINYAKRIQNAILPSERQMKNALPNSFVLYKPKDIVAGDFYWIESFTEVSDTNGTTKNGVLFAAADCTGHGVPGAMVSVVCNNGLKRSVREFGLKKPGEILDKTRELVVNEFGESEEEVKDGMDIALCLIEENKLSYAGAHNPLWIIRSNSNELEEIKANKQPIGKYEGSKPFTTHEIKWNRGDQLYIFSDGFIDQFGGADGRPGGKKFKSGNFKKLLLAVKDLPVDEQKIRILKAFEAWKGDLEQLDDVCVIGVRG